MAWGPLSGLQSLIHPRMRRYCDPKYRKTVTASKDVLNLYSTDSGRVFPCFSSSVCESFCGHKGNPFAS